MILRHRDFCGGLEFLSALRQHKARGNMQRLEKFPESRQLQPSASSARRAVDEHDWRIRSDGVEHVLAGAHAFRRRIILRAL